MKISRGSGRFLEVAVVFCIKRTWFSRCFGATSPDLTFICNIETDVTFRKAVAMQFLSCYDGRIKTLGWPANRKNAEKMMVTGFRAFTADAVNPLVGYSWGT